VVLAQLASQLLAAARELLSFCKLTLNLFVRLVLLAFRGPRVDEALSGLGHSLFPRGDCH
jgi:hypothetical protein